MVSGSVRVSRVSDSVRDCFTRTVSMAPRALNITIGLGIRLTTIFH